MSARTERLEIGLTADELAALELEALNDGASVSAWVRRAALERANGKRRRRPPNLNIRRLLPLALPDVLVQPGGEEQKAMLTTHETLIARVLVVPRVSRRLQLTLMRIGTRAPLWTDGKAGLPLGCELRWELPSDRPVITVTPSVGVTFAFRNLSSKSLTVRGVTLWCEPQWSGAERLGVPPFRYVR